MNQKPHEELEKEAYINIFLLAIGLIIVFANNLMFSMYNISNMEGTAFIFFFEVCGLTLWFTWIHYKVKIRNNLYKCVNLSVNSIAKLYKGICIMIKGDKESVY